MVALLQNTLPQNGSSSRYTERELDLDVLLMIMELLSDDIPALSACSLVCFSWFLPARRSLFRSIYLRSSARSSSSSFDLFLRSLERLEHSHNDIEHPDVTINTFSGRRQVDFRPYVQELHLVGNSHYGDRQMLANHRRADWDDILSLRVHRILHIIRRLPQLRLVEFRNPSSFFSPLTGRGAMWPIFCALGPHVQEIWFENNFSLVEYESDPFRWDLEEALDYPSPSPATSHRLRTLVMDDFDSCLPRFWDHLAEMGLDMPPISSLTLPLAVVGCESFKRALPLLGQYLEHLRFEIMKPKMRAYCLALLNASHSRAHRT